MVRTDTTRPAQPASSPWSLPTISCEYRSCLRSIVSQARASGDTEPWNPTRCRGNKHVGEYHCPRESSPLKRPSRDVSSAFIVKGHLSMHLSMRRTGWQKDDASEGCVLPLGRVSCWDHESFVSAELCPPAKDVS